MDAQRLRQLLTEVEAGEISVDRALERLRGFPYEDIGIARLDSHRAMRTGIPEVVYCESKTTEQALDILRKLATHHDRVMGTRMSSEMAAVILAEIPQSKYDPTSRLLTLAKRELPPQPEHAPYALVVSAGTADLPVAEEAAQTLEFMNTRVERALDVGVAGIHRLFDEKERLFNADVIISVAGMEGALTSLVGGLVACPVIGVPTSVGYGSNFDGLSALLAMLNSCAAGVAVVNIDNGFGAGLYAHLMLRKFQEGIKK